MQASPDSDILDRAIREDRIVISADTDFGTLIALMRLTAPSVILFRRSYPRRPERQAKLLIENLAALEEPLGRGCLAVIEQNRIRIRQFPIRE
jgi:predicted nuclease of predicted toxin-antitoxin system